MNDAAVLAVNVGSSSIKAARFVGDKRQNFHYAHIGGAALPDHQAAFGKLMADLGGDAIDAIGHRITHGGDVAEPARIIDEREKLRLQKLAPLAPLHQPQNLLGVALCAQRFSVPQIACFDTAFHRSLPELAWRLPLSDKDEFKRYGFHGLAYASVARMLPNLLGAVARKRVIVAHLGSGASLCLLENLQSQDTTMSLTPLGGLPMGTRSGDLDPGVVLELVKRYGADAATQQLYHHSGLLALSGGLTSDMQILLRSGTRESRFAVTYFCQSVAAAIGAFAAKAGGIEALVFTGGIGEHSAAVRAQICAPLAFMGISKLNETEAGDTGILNPGASLPVLKIKVDEELEIATFARAMLNF